jgi:folate-dependent tRNA-U54 methylase TrmFO/GidA|tara:strand:- start:1725 stop:1892 length:168 start_codon:yes stop_codon:yes gene_type:complete
MNTTFHVYDNNNTPVGDLINLDEEQLLKKIKERVNKHKELTIVKVESEDMTDASY